MKNIIILTILLCLYNIDLMAQDAVLVGDVQCVDCDGEHIAFASVAIMGTSIGTATDATGHFMIPNIPVGKHKVKATAIGFKPEVKEFEITANQTVEIKFKLQEDKINLEDVVVTGTRYELDRREAPVMVNVIDDQLFQATQAVSLSEGLNFQPGLRMENNCQNCGFTQVRMNGLQGPYTQILINSRPIFSALQGVYGLDQIPANMIERVEVVRGGGSALYGGNAIAGTINIITKDPVVNTYEVNSNYNSINGNVPDYTLNANVSLVSDDLKNGINLYGMVRDRDWFDANGDGFSEITVMENKTIGGKAYVKPNDRSKITLDFHGINEYRRGGNLFSRPPHQTDIAEELEHQIFGGGIAYELYDKNLKNKYAVYSSIQSTQRKSYYGFGGNLDEFDPDQYYTDEEGNFIPLAEYLMDEIGRLPTNIELQLANQNLRYSLANAAASYYGDTDDLAMVSGMQFTRSQGKGTFTGGAEVQINRVTDRMPGYDRLIEQSTTNMGVYSQYEYKPTGKLTLLGGLRYDLSQIDGNYRLFGESLETDLLVDALNPRLNILYKPRNDLQVRASYARGFRAPQAFDEDLHIETVGGAAQFIRLSPELQKETSDAFTLSSEYTSSFGNTQVYLLLEGFYTRLYNPFVNIGLLQGDAETPAILEKRNALEDAIVTGLNIESRLAPGNFFNIQLGGTLQSARYNQPIELYSAEDTDGTSIFEDRILRTPDWYGYFMSTFNFSKKLVANLSGVYTGSMAQPYESGLQKPLGVYTTPDFLELNFKISYEFNLLSEMDLQLNAGIQNIFNSYQDDFDTGIDRDAAYVYGPQRPRTYFLGVKFGNF
ncbi:MAG: TonB-dependent receptor [Cyclobacteriaceae bacterium]